MVELFSANILLNYVTGQVKVRSHVKITTFILVGYGLRSPADGYFTSVIHSGGIYRFPGLGRCSA